jgi:hypothetical protein
MLRLCAQVGGRVTGLPALLRTKTLTFVSATPSRIATATQGERASCGRLGGAGIHLPKSWGLKKAGPSVRVRTLIPAFSQGAKERKEHIPLYNGWFGREVSEGDEE